MIGYYKRFIKNYGWISKPLTTFLKKNLFSWCLEAICAFQKLKHAMTTAPPLTLSNFSKPFIVETDTYDKRIGAVLMQECRPIAYFSKVLAAKY